MDAVTVKANVGVVIGRFQTPNLTQGHRNLIGAVRSRHQKVIVLLGRTKDVMVTRRNPLDFLTRKAMLQAEWPDLVILPIKDMPTDEAWSRAVDAMIEEAIGVESVALYGSRDSFIPHYHGRFPTVELEESTHIRATQVRELASDAVRASEEFRRGVVYAAFNRHPVSFQTVDIAVVRMELERPPMPINIPEPSIPRYFLALGRKETDPPGKWRFPGGFVRPRFDQSLEQAAVRELGEELPGLDTGPMTYVSSHAVDDWRYRTEEDSILTALFTTNFRSGLLKASDDLAEAKWHELTGTGDLEDRLVPEHRKLLRSLQHHLEKGV